MSDNGAPEREPRRVRWRLATVLEQRELSIRRCSIGARVSYPALLRIVHDRATRVDLITLGSLCRFLKVKPGDLLEFAPADQVGEAARYDWPVAAR